MFYTFLNMLTISKNQSYSIIMKFTVEKIPQAKAEIDSLEQSQKKIC